VYIFFSDVACNILGYERGLPLCCSPFGFSFISPLFGKLQCTGKEKHLTDCPFIQVKLTKILYIGILFQVQLK
jgi:hypothetical protein